MPHPSIYEQGDPVEYETLAWNLAHGNGYNLGGAQGLFAHYIKERLTKPTARRMPMYPIMIAAIYFTVGRHYKAIFLAQAFIDTLTCLIIFFLTDRIFKSKKAGLIATILYVTYIPFLETNHVLMSETLYIFFLYAGLFLLVIGLENRSPKYHILAGVVFGFANLTRIDIFYAIPPILVVILYSFKDQIPVHC